MTEPPDEEKGPQRVRFGAESEPEPEPEPTTRSLFGRPSSVRKTLSPRDLSFFQIQHRTLRYMLRSSMLGLRLSCLGVLFVLIPLVLTMLHAASALVAHVPTTVNASADVMDDVASWYIVRYHETEHGGYYIAPRFLEVPKLTQAPDDVLWPMAAYILVENLPMVGVFYVSPYYAAAQWYGWTPLVRGRLLYVMLAGACYQIVSNTFWDFDLEFPKKYPSLQLAWLLSLYAVCAGQVMHTFMSPTRQSWRQTLGPTLQGCVVLALGEQVADYVLVEYFSTDSPSKRLLLRGFVMPCTQTIWSIGVRQAALSYEIVHTDNYFVILMLPLALSTAISDCMQMGSVSLSEALLSNVATCVFKVVKYSVRASQNCREFKRFVYCQAPRKRCCRWMYDAWNRIFCGRGCNANGDGAEDKQQDDVSKVGNPIRTLSKDSVQREVEMGDWRSTLGEGPDTGDDAMMSDAARAGQRRSSNRDSRPAQRPTSEVREERARLARTNLISMTTPLEAASATLIFAILICLPVSPNTTAGRPVRRRDMAALWSIQVAVEVLLPAALISMINQQHFCASGNVFDVLRTSVRSFSPGNLRALAVISLSCMGYALTTFTSALCATSDGRSGLRSISKCP